MLFFAIPFPMILYYSINYNRGIANDGTEPWLAMIYLFISVFLWLMVLYQLYRLFIAQALKAKAKVKFLLKEGVFSFFSGIRFCFAQLFCCFINLV